MDKLLDEINNKRKAQQDSSARPQKYMRRADIERLKQEELDKKREEQEAKKREAALAREKEKAGLTSSGCRYRMALTLHTCRTTDWQPSETGRPRPRNHQPQNPLHQTPKHSTFPHLNAFADYEPRENPSCCSVKPRKTVDYVSERSNCWTNGAASRADTMSSKKHSKRPKRPWNIVRLMTEPRGKPGEAMM